MSVSAEPFAVAGRSLTGEKRWVDGTHRVRPPEETLELIRPLLRRAGVTRLPDVTGLDRIGLPVVLAVRPGSDWLSVDAGKGTTRVAATVSAGMEAIERHRGETRRLESFTATHRELEAAGHAIPLERLPLTRSSVFHPTVPEHWVWGWDLVAGERVAVPEAVVHYGRRSRPEPEHLRFQHGSNGLAAGNTFLEAIVAGLHEVIERDAVTCWVTAGVWANGRRLPDERLAGTRAAPLLEQVASGGVDARVFDLTVDTEVPTFCTFLFERGHGGALGAKGYGCHLDADVALERSITEAALARLVWIAGSRDDLFTRAFRWSGRIRDDGVAGLDRVPPARELPVRGDASTPTLQGDLRVLLGRLRRSGLDQAIVVDLSEPDEPVAVVKVVVPGLEGYMFSFYRPGLRAEQFRREVS